MDQTEQALLKFAGVFVPELKPLIPDIVKALATAEKVDVILQKYKAAAAQP
jgi:hypothetical protein